MAIADLPSGVQSQQLPIVFLRPFGIALSRQRRTNIDKEKGLRPEILRDG
jgi:hypothetical protein